MTPLVAQVAALTAERDAWMTATVLTVMKPVYPGAGSRTYTGVSAQAIIVALLAATNAELATATTALTTCMAGR